MQANTPVTRFKVGETYRLRSSPDFPRLLGGSMTVLSEIKPTDLWGNRIILVDCTLDAANAPELQSRSYKGARCFVEEGYAKTDGGDLIPAEVATLQNTYPYFAKAYATDGYGESAVPLAPVAEVA